MYEFKTALNTNTFISLKILEALMQKNLTDEDKAKIIAEGFAELETRYPDLKYVVTRENLSETELKLIKEIELIRKEIKDVEFRLSKEIKELDSKLSKEIKNVEFRLSKEMKELDNKLSKEIRELDVKLSRDISDNKLSTIKWVAGMMVAQVVAIGGMFFTAFRFFAQ